MHLKQFLKKADEAVSPVVATLMLVLVAAGAAVGLSVFMGSFQEDAQENLNSDASTDQKLKIAGSSTVFEFSKVALDGVGEVPGFEAFAKQAGSPISVELEKGGSGAGRQAVGLCLIDIGSSSSDPLGDDDIVNSWPDCDGDGNQDYGQEMEIFHIAYDTLAIVWDEDIAPCTSMQITEAQVYELYRVNGAGETRADDGTNDIFGNAVGGSGPYTFDDISADPEITCSGSTAIVLGHRTDPGGTEEGFCKKVMKDGRAGLNSALSGTFDVTGTDESFGCTSDDQLDETAFASLVGGDGNQGIASGLASGAIDLSFIGAGHIQTAGGLDNAELADGDSTDFRGPTDVSAGAPAVRSLYYITAGEPTPVEQIWLDFVLDPHRNQLIAQGAGYVSVY